MSAFSESCPHILLGRSRTTLCEFLLTLLEAMTRTLSSRSHHKVGHMLHSTHDFIIPVRLCRFWAETFEMIEKIVGKIILHKSKKSQAETVPVHHQSVGQKKRSSTAVLASAHLTDVGQIWMKQLLGSVCTCENFSSGNRGLDFDQNHMESAGIMEALKTSISHQFATSSRLGTSSRDAMRKIETWTARLLNWNRENSATFL